MKINLKDIVKLQDYEMKIFIEEDNDFPDYRVVEANERQIYKILNRYTNDKTIQNQIRKIIYHEMWDRNDTTFKPICDSLRKIGFEILKKS